MVVGEAKEEGMEAGEVGEEVPMEAPTEAITEEAITGAFPHVDVQERLPLPQLQQLFHQELEGQEY